MPNFDRTGPRGEGSKTGRGLGKCDPKKNEDEKNDLQKLGRGIRGFFGRRGGGRGNRQGR